MIQAEGSKQRDTSDGIQAEVSKLSCPYQRPILRARAPSFLSSFRVYAKCIWLDEQVEGSERKNVSRRIRADRYKLH